VESVNSPLKVIVPVEAALTENAEIARAAMSEVLISVFFIAIILN